MENQKDTYIARPNYSVEKLNIMLSDLFVKYADKEDDNIKNVENGTDFTTFDWNIHHSSFIIDDTTKKNIQNDANRLCILERDYQIHLKDHHSMPELISKKLIQIEKIFMVIKKNYPDVKIPENLRNI